MLDRSGLPVVFLMAGFDQQSPLFSNLSSMQTREQALESATEMANSYITEKGSEALGDRSFEDLVDRFLALILEHNQDPDWVE
jgi:hypothetical protein